MEARGETLQRGSLDRIPTWALAGGVAALIATVLVVLAVAGGDSLPERLGPPVEELAVERTTLAPNEIELTVRNTGPEQYAVEQQRQYVSLGGLVIASAGDLIGDDIRQVWRVAAARSEDLYERRHGNPRILIARELEVGYDDVQVLFGVDMEIREGEIVALLGTNGAGKSTLLRAICGVVEADRGAVVFDGIDITHAPPYEIAARGVVQVPGRGRGLPVADRGREPAPGGLAAAQGRPERRPRPRWPGPSSSSRSSADRGDEPAGDLSGGQQQMLALGMALIAQPKLLMIDELSLGLAPVVVERLLPARPGDPGRRAPR